MCQQVVYCELCHYRVATQHVPAGKGFPDTHLDVCTECAREVD